MSDCLEAEGGSSRAAVGCGYVFTVSQLEFAKVQTPLQILSAATVQPQRLAVPVV